MSVICFVEIQKKMVTGILCLSSMSFIISAGVLLCPMSANWFSPFIREYSCCM